MHNVLILHDKRTLKKIHNFHERVHVFGERGYVEVFVKLFIIFFFLYIYMNNELK